MRQIGSHLGRTSAHYIKYVYQYSRLPYFLHGAGYAHGFDGVLGIPYARGIDDAERYTLYIKHFFDHIPGGARHIAHNRPVFIEQRIEQSTLAGIGAAGDDRSDPLLDGIAQLKGGYQLPQQLPQFGYQQFQVVALGKFDVFLAKVEFQFDQAREVNQFLPQRFQPVAVAAAHLQHRLPVGSLAACRDEIGYRLSLAQVQFASQKGPHGKFARLRQAGTMVLQQFQHFLQNVGRAMAANLNHIFARVGARRQKKSDDYLVQHLALRIDDAPNMRRMARLRCQLFSPKKPCDNAHSCRA